MQSLDDFEFLVIGLFHARLHEMRAVIERIVEEKFGPGRFCITDAPLDISSVYERRPPRGGAHDKRAVFYEPACSGGTTALIANMEDGWVTMCNVLAAKLPGEHILARSCVDTQYPLTDFEVWDNGASVRYVGALREDPSWDFSSRGEGRPFEDPTNYKKRRISDRLNREILVEYLGKLGWHLASAEFWKSHLPACYLQENMLKK